MSTMKSSKWTLAEEDRRPEQLGRRSLEQWKQLNKRNLASEVDAFGKVHVDLPKTIRTDFKSFLLADQHRMGLDPAIKRHRRLLQQVAEFRPRTNPNLPPYLQDVEKYNPELMRSSKTEVHSLLPDLKGGSIVRAGDLYRF